MSKMTKCDEGHFFDKEQNSKCPFCGVGPQLDLTRKADVEALRSSVERDDAPTRAFGGSDRRSTLDHGAVDDGATIAVWAKKGGIDPVVGWFVCCEGVDQGRDYRIRSGYNNIGRDTSSQICVAGDNTIARIEHAKVFYDLKNAAFHLIAGSGRSGAYVNGAVVLQSVQLKAFDVVEIGATSLVFIPLCGERFRWDTHKAARNPEVNGGEGADNRGADDRTGSSAATGNGAAGDPTVW
jgi:hypothetical protein